LQQSWEPLSPLRYNAASQCSVIPDKPTPVPRRSARGFPNGEAALQRSREPLSPLRHNAASQCSVSPMHSHQYPAGLHEASPMARQHCSNHANRFDPFGITLHHSAALYRCTQTKLPGAGGILVQLRVTLSYPLVMMWLWRTFSTPLGLGVIRPTVEESLSSGAVGLSTFIGLIDRRLAGLPRYGRPADSAPVTSPNDLA
jgi:hypothetical protein